jgi:hypothetical protein
MFFDVNGELRISESRYTSLPIWHKGKKRVFLSGNKTKIFLPLNENLPVEYFALVILYW